MASTSAQGQPIPLPDSASRMGPHVPGEFPTETGEEPHVPGAFPQTPALEKTDDGLGSSVGAGAAGAGGLTTGGIVGAEDTKSPAPEQPSQPSGQDMPIVTPTNSVSHASPEPQTEAEPESHLGRDAAIAGGATAAAGAGGYGLYEATKGDEPSTTDTTAPTTGTIEPTSSSKEAAGPVGDAAPAKATEPSMQPQIGDSGVGHNETSGPLNSHKHDTAPVAAEDDRHYGRDAAIAGGGAATAGAAGYGLYEASKDDNAPEAVPPASGSSAPLNRQKHDATLTDADDKPVLRPLNSHKHDPALADADEGHHTGRDAAIAGGATAAAGAAGYGLYEASKDNDAPEAVHPSTTEPPVAAARPVSSQTEPEHHYGRDAAIAGGAGALGYGAYEATRPNEVPQQIPQDRVPPRDTSKLATEKPGKDHKEKPVKQEAAKATKPVTAAPIKSEPVKPEETKPEETHYGRDAAIVGGTGAAAGAAGYGLYEANQHDPQDTGPASKTIGPHESNIANILDPRVKPDPEKMKEKEPITTGPYKSDLANIADPRVQRDPARAEEQQRYDPNYGRDAAVAGGVGAAGLAGAGAYEATKDRDTTPTEPTRHSLEASNNKVSVDSHGHHHLHKKSVEEQGEKKPGLMRRIIHPNKSKKELQEFEAKRRSLEEPFGADKGYERDPIRKKVSLEGNDAVGGAERGSGEHVVGGRDMADPTLRSEHVGTDGPIGDSHHVSGAA